MEIVIKITEEDYERVKKKFQMNMNIMANAIAHGTPLPEHHGRLIILSEARMKENQIHLDFSSQNWISEVGLSNATVAIIEADKGE